MNVTDKELYQGYAICECGDGVRLLQAGFDCDMHLCGTCKSEVADVKEFFKFQTGAEILSK